MTISALLSRARPPSPLAGRLSVQSLLFALGEGTFLTGSAVFFTKIAGLSAAQVGLGLTLAGIAAFLAAVPMGKLVDRFGPKKDVGGQRPPGRRQCSRSGRSSPISRATSPWPSAWR